MILNLAAAVGLGLLLSGSSPAAPRVFVDAGAGPLAPEARVTIRWEGLPADAGECEILLDVDADGGRGRLRITGELDPREGSYRWTVPNLSVRGARIVLRMNRSGHEIEIAPSAPFDIGTAGDAPRAQLSHRGGELWLTDDEGEDGECEPDAPRPIFAGPPAVLVARVVEAVAALPRSFAGIQTAPAADRPARLAPISPTRNPARPVFGLSTLFVPPRI